MKELAVRTVFKFIHKKIKEIFHRIEADVSSSEDEHFNNAVSLTPSRRLIVQADPLYRVMEPGVPYNIQTIDSYIDMMSQGEPQASLLTAKESFVLSTGTQRQKADIRRKLQKEFTVVPLMIDKNEMMRNRLVKSNMFRSNNPEPVHLITGIVSKTCSI